MTGIGNGSDNDTVRVSPEPFKKEIVVPTSKSYANRQLVLAAILKNPVTIRSLPESTDVTTMLSCFLQIGIKFRREGDDVTILNSFPECERDFPKDRPVILNTGDGGTTNRFLLAMLARGERVYFLNAAEGITKRPIMELIDVMESLGVLITRGRSQEDSFWLKVQGPYKIDPRQNVKAFVDSSRSTQFASALALALADKSNVEIIPEKIKSSRKYYDLTLSLLKKLPADFFQVPVDFSSLSYPLALALTFGEVLVSNCKEKDPFQADSIFLDLIGQMGGKLEFGGDDGLGGLFLKKIPRPRPLDIDCSAFPDLVPTLAFVCSYADGTTYLRNLEVLHYKESDRIREIIKVLKLFEVDFQYQNTEEVLIIKGDVERKTAFREFFPPPDHRIIMMSYLFMRKNSGGIIHNASHVNKSFPDFFNGL